MGMTIDDDVKRQLLDKLAEEPAMVISTAYAYAKNYVMYGEDITKAWTTAIQQASILEQVKIKAQAEAYDSFKKEYENRLADMYDKDTVLWMLRELQLEIDELPNHELQSSDWKQGFTHGLADVQEKVIQKKINELKEKDNGK